MKRTLALMLMLLATAASATATRPVYSESDDVAASDVLVHVSTREGEGRKAQWAPSGNFSTLNGRAVSRGETREETSPYGREGVASAVGSGIFLSRDSVEGSLSDAPSLHRFAYAHANPLRYVDIDGHCVDLATGQVSMGMCRESAKAFAGGVAGAVLAIGKAGVGVADLFTAGGLSKAIADGSHLTQNLREGHFLDTPEQVEQQGKAQRQKWADQAEMNAHPIEYAKKEFGKWWGEKVAMAERGETFSLSADFGETAMDGYMVGRSFVRGSKRVAPGEAAVGEGKPANVARGRPPQWRRPRLRMPCNVPALRPGRGCRPARARGPSRRWKSGSLYSRETRRAVHRSTAPSPDASLRPTRKSLSSSSRTRMATIPRSA